MTATEGSSCAAVLGSLRPRCPYAQRTWITLEEKGVPYKRTVVSRRHLAGFAVEIRVRPYKSLNQPNSHKPFKFRFGVATSRALKTLTAFEGKRAQLHGARVVCEERQPFGEGAVHSRPDGRNCSLRV